jgi:hypothetical protein
LETKKQNAEARKRIKELEDHIKQEEINKKVVKKAISIKKNKLKKKQY